MRITIEDKTFQKIVEILRSKNENEIVEELKSAEEKYNSSITENKKTAPKKANQTKVKNSKKKIENAINLIRLEGDNITAYRISQKSGVAYNTAKKYLKEINMQ